jgi:CRISPR-associated protein Csd1
MILQRLAEHYDRIASQSELAPPGWSQQRVSFCILLDPDGTLVDFQDVRVLDGKKMRAPLIIVPGQSKPPGAGITPCFLWDSPEYLLGVSNDPAKEKRAPLTFAAFRDEHLALEQTIHHPEFSAVCAFLRGWKPEDAGPWKAKLAEVATNFGVFRIAGQQRFVHQVVIRPDAVAAQADAAQSMCLVTGKHGRIARLHEPKIKGVTGAQTAGALLVSFNATAFESYGKDQGGNAPVGETTVFKYANALNHLLSTRRKGLGDATITWWADGVALDVEALLEDIFGAAVAKDEAEAAEPSEEVEKEHAARVEQAGLLVSQLQSGTKISGKPRPDGTRTRYFILGLSPNASRLSVRMWVEEDASELMSRLQRHLDDMTLQTGRHPPALWNIVAATGRAEHEANGRFKKFDTTAVSPQLAGDLTRAVLTGTAYPQSLLSTMIRRVRSDGEVHFARVSAVKAVLVRNSRTAGKPQEIPLELDTNQSDVAYRCGRLFALLEKAQSDSLGGDLNSTIKDRYFSSASATPALVFPRLFRLNGHHLAKVEPRTKIFYERQIGNAMEAPFSFPRQLTLEQQGRFIIGYFQQRQNLYTKKEAPSNEGAVIA